MAKNCFIFWCLLFLGCSYSSCVSETGVKDITSDTDITTGAAVPILDQANNLPADIDTVSIVTVIEKNDTTKTILIAEKSIDHRSLLIDWYNKQIGIREATGKNDGPEIKLWLASVGLKQGNPYCAAFVHYGLNISGVKNNISGYSPTAFDRKKAVWFQNKFLEEPEPGDVFTLYFPSKKRIAHTGFFDHKVNSTIYETVEANTNDQLSREGDGVYRKKRSFKSTYAITDFIENKNK